MLRRFTGFNMCRVVIGGLLAGMAFNAQAMDLEVTGGSTFGSSGAFLTNTASCSFLLYARRICGKLHETAVASVNLITSADSVMPTEWSAGYIFGQHKNADNRWNNNAPTAYIGAGKRLEWHGLFVGLDIVAVNTLSQRLSSVWNFKSQIGFHYGPVVALVEHISNAGIRLPNDGVDMYMVGLRFGL